MRVALRRVPVCWSAAESKADATQHAIKRGAGLRDKFLVNATIKVRTLRRRFADSTRFCLQIAFF